ncbi:hypothetical protein DFR24_3535 [Panacagrimonas perspica]|uniref:Uncharacterized protein n=1 Tax=Panacagrimonas perspica TaxID=381431 RepID=A0A4S3K2C3_9GAMM|nr:hypothetical protein [Panacagrimonas perspica]TDU26508.1 hypothetical protein DFR24_3535 [Panacagrimonas perspica]THD02119.1 hypothetical protein B1810_16740 [Panacagrimonas perspica]
MERQPVTFHPSLYNSGLLVLAALCGWAGYRRSSSIAVAIFCGVLAVLACAWLIGVLRIVINKRRLKELGTEHDPKRLDDAHYFGGRGLLAGTSAYFFVQVSAESVFVQIGMSVRRIAWNDISQIELLEVGSSTFAEIKGVFPRPSGELVLPWAERFNTHVPERVYVARC